MQAGEKQLIYRETSMKESLLDTILVKRKVPGLRR